MPYHLCTRCHFKVRMNSKICPICGMLAYGGPKSAARQSANENSEPQHSASIHYNLREPNASGENHEPAVRRQEF